MKFGKKVSNIIKKEFESKPVYNEKYLRTKIKSYNGKINTIFNNNKIPEKGSQCICLSVIWINLFIEKIKTIILKCLWKNVNMLFKKRRLRLLLTT